MSIDYAAEAPETGAEPAESFEEPAAAPAVIYTAYFSAVDELVEHVKAAETLNLGFRVESYLVTPEEAPDTQQVEFEFTLLNEQPVRDEDRD
ncbi:hypothetical protein [Dactylosporangium sp. NPDC051541]|uniref:hypothetical protein n=1 Tax=Dactylosporangium sp. NPDC051541 TaxID=3363977 RepID=UPI0037B011DF